MTTPYQWRRDPQPISQGWEIAAATIGAAVVGLGFAALAGLGLASALFGGGWVWPRGTDTISHVLGGVLTGHPGRGLPPAQLDRVAAPGAVYGCIAGCELIALALAVTAAVLVARYRRPSDARRGMARRTDAEQALGISTLRSAKEIIRPDLYGEASGVPAERSTWARLFTGRRQSTDRPFPRRAENRAAHARPTCVSQNDLPTRSNHEHD